MEFEDLSRLLRDYMNNENYYKILLTYKEKNLKPFRTFSITKEEETLLILLDEKIYIYIDYSVDRFLDKFYYPVEKINVLSLIKGQFFTIPLTENNKILFAEKILNSILELAHSIEEDYKPEMEYLTDNISDFIKG